MQPPVAAAEMMRTDNIDFLFFCEDRAAYAIYAKAAPDSLAAQLVNEGQMVGFVKIPLEMGEGLSLWQPE